MDFKNMMKMVMGNPSEALAEVVPLIAEQYQPVLAQFLKGLEADNLEPGEHHLGLHVFTTDGAGIKIHVVAVDEEGNAKRNIQELPFELIFGFQLLTPALKKS